MNRSQLGQGHKEANQPWLRMVEEMNALVSFVEAMMISRRNHKDLILFRLFALTPLNLLNMRSYQHLPPTLVIDPLSPPIQLPNWN